MIWIHSGISCNITIIPGENNINRIIESNTLFCEEKFVDLDLSGSSYEQIHFEYCKFSDCKLNKIKFKKCRFTDCIFQSSSLSLTNFDSCVFIDTEFNSCNMKGINWTKIIIPLIVIASPIHFNSCDISYSSFYEMKLPSISIINCKAHEVDLRGSDISMSDLSATDFEGSQFNNTNLVNTDLRNAIHYSINPMENEIKQAKFSLPEVIRLLDSFEIEIDECN